MYTVHPSQAECYFVRLLLHNVKGPTSFENLRQVPGRQEPCGTFREACQVRGLLASDQHWDDTLTEAIFLKSPHKLRELFAILLVCCEVGNPSQLWDKHKEELSEDILYTVRMQNPDTNVDFSPAIFNKCLVEIEDKVLTMGGKELHHPSYGLPRTTRDQAHLLSHEILRETSYDKERLDSYVQENEPRLVPDQRNAYQEVLKSIEDGSGGIFFLDAPGGTGKTFTTNLLLANIRRRGCIALAVASSGIAATLLEGGRTAHSAFKLPLNLAHEKEPTCNISKDTALAKLLRDSKLIVWDEATMSHKGAFEALDRTMRDFRSPGDPRKARPMGGVTMVLSGDFRQTLPVIPKGTKADELNACLKRSILWRNIKQLQLSTNMRVHIHKDKSAQVFSRQLLQIGNGDIPLDPKEGLHLLPCGMMVTSIDDLKQKVFPNLHLRYRDAQWLRDRAILAPKNDAVDKLNEDLLKELPGTASSFRSFDSVVDEDNDAVHYPVEFLNTLQPPGMPPHNLILKPGAPILLLRNLNAPKLCNGTRLVVKTLRSNLIEATIITGSSKGEDVFIPRIPLIPKDMPFDFKRVQFPVKLSFAMTINKAQGQSLKIVGLNLLQPCFSHGQLYVGCSRVGNPRNLYIFTEIKGKTENIVYKEAL